MATKQSTQKPQEKASPKLSVRIQKLFDDENSKVKAVASLNIDDAFAVHGIKVIDSEKGMFVSMPSNSYKNSDGETKYQDIFHPVTAEARQELIDAVTDAYNQALEMGMCKAHRRHNRLRLELQQ